MNETAAHTPPSAAFWDRIADRYARRPVADESAYQTKLAATRTFLRPEMRLLEVGCGTGSTAIAHAPFVASIHATDLSPRMVEIAAKKAALANADNVECEVASLESLAERSRRYDGVLALSLLHLLDDLDQGLRTIHERVVPGGLFVSNTTCLGDGMNWFRPLAAIGHGLGRIPRVRFLRRDHLLERIDRAGFDIEHAWCPGDGRTVFLIARRRA